MEIIDFSNCIITALGYGLRVSISFSFIGFGVGAFIHVINKLT